MTEEVTAVEALEEQQEQQEQLDTSSHEIFTSKTFNFEMFSFCMKKSISESSDNNDVDLENYLLAYEQLYNFFRLLGTAFQFVATDVKSKIKILKSFRDNEVNCELNNFSTVRSMVDYEVKNQLLTNSKYVSGCRTLLRLHRGLDFVRKFLEQLYILKNNVRLGEVAKDIYNQTLAEYHTWMVRGAARMAMQFLPTRSQLLAQISAKGSCENLNKVLELFPDAIESMNVVYNTVQAIFTENKLLNLP